MSAVSAAGGPKIVTTSATAASTPAPQTVSKPCLVTVGFKEKLERKQLYAEIDTIDRPNVILWYMLKVLFEKCAAYYKKDITKIQPKAERCHLYDLTAWAATREKSLDITSENPNADRINSSPELTSRKICCLKSSGFFLWLKNLNGPELDYLQKVILKREFIFRASKDAKELGVTIADLFKGQCPAFESLYKTDAERAYSALQYIEGIYLIKTIAEQNLSRTNSKVINIVFALFNNESEYYRDAEGSFAKDVTAFLTMPNDQRFRDRQISVMFLNVNYGTRASGTGNGVASGCLKWRPYLEQSAIIKEVTADQVVDIPKPKIKAKKASDSSEAL